MKTVHRFFVLLLPLTAVLVTSPLFSQQQELTKYLTVESVAFDNTTALPQSLVGQVAPVEIKLRNVGAKAITAFHSSLKLTYPGGIARNGNFSGADLIESIAQMNIPNVVPVPNMTLNPDESFSHRVMVPLLGGQAPALMTVDVDTILFDDRTWLGDPKEAKNWFSSRKSRSETVGALLSAVNDAEGAGDPDARYRALINNPGLAKLDRSNTAHVVSRLQKYHQARKTSEFGMMLKIDQARLQALTDHSVPAAPIKEQVK